MFSGPLRDLAVKHDVGPSTEWKTAFRTRPLLGQTGMTVDLSNNKRGRRRKIEGPRYELRGA